MYTPKGKFAWYELMTTDTAAAGKFYSSVVGWSTRDVGMPSMPYTTFNLGEIGQAGMMTVPPEAAAMGAGPSWIGYINVEDCDAHVAKIVEAGGKLCKPAVDVPGMLRFAVMTDPQGTPFVVFSNLPGMTPPANRPMPPDTGTIGWHELYANDLETAFEFYSSLFGWTKDSDMDMGPMGIYRIFSDGTKQIGGMMTKPPNMPAPFWTYYFHVDNINAAVERLKAGGGTVTMGPYQVPGDSWIVLGHDPQGATFALVSPNA
jgi:predicted enzyme related to lactoylglutathione lyase